MKENWNADFFANPLIIYDYNMKKLKKALSVWSRATYTDIFQKIKSLEEAVIVHKAQFELNPTHLNRERIQKVRDQFIRCLSLEEEFWKQKASMSWF